MAKNLEIFNRSIGEGAPCFIIGEIGINHNGDLTIAKRLVEIAASLGLDAVKFQKRNPDKCVPPEQKDILRETPWGVISYLDYRYKVEFGIDEYKEIDQFCQKRGIIWIASSWDEDSVDFIEQFNPPCHKIASALLTDDDLLRIFRSTGRPIILSTGMSTLDQIDHAVDVLGTEELIILHCTSTYPSKPEELNLKSIKTLKERYDVPVGYSGHEVGLATTLGAVALGACMIERHITLDRAMWGGDQAASVEPHGVSRLVRDIRNIEKALGDGKIQVYDSEKPLIKKLRKVIK